ncbi:MAG: hypothetical protein Q8P73_04450 [bacterium]|nr:hypothetical protein [bacterium]
MVAKYSEWTRGQDEALLNKLGGMKVALRLLNCREVNVEFGDEETVATVAAIAPKLKVWRRIKLGTGLKTADDFRQAIKDNDLRLGDWASDILGKEAFTVAIEEQEVDLVVMSVKELGFKGNARFDQICARAKELGLELCPAEVGPQLRLQYLDQPKNEWLIIAMEAIRDSDGHLGVFDVEHVDDGRWLRAGGGDPVSVWYPDDRFVFVSCKALVP